MPALSLKAIPCHTFGTQLHTDMVWGYRKKGIYCFLECSSIYGFGQIRRTKMNIKPFFSQFSCFCRLEKPPLARSRCRKNWNGSHFAKVWGLATSCSRTLSWKSVLLGHVAHRNQRISIVVWINIEVLCNFYVCEVPGCTMMAPSCWNTLDWRYVKLWTASRKRMST